MDGHLVWWTEVQPAETPPIHNCLAGVEVIKQEVRACYDEAVTVVGTGLNRWFEGCVLHHLIWTDLFVVKLR